MASTNKTAHYDLPQFAQNDVTGWISDINPAMAAIDAGIWAAKQSADSAGTAASDAATAAQTAQTLAQTAKAGADSAQTTATAAQTAAGTATTTAQAAQTAASGAQTTANSALTKANQATTDLAGTLVELDPVLGGVLDSIRAKQVGLLIAVGGFISAINLQTLNSWGTMTLKAPDSTVGQKTYTLYPLADIPQDAFEMTAVTPGFTASTFQSNRIKLGANAVVGVSGECRVYRLGVWRDTAKTYIGIMKESGSFPSDNATIAVSGILT